MINYEFYCPTKILFGKDTELKVGEETVKHSKNVLIVYGSDRIKKSGLFILSLLASMLMIINISK